MNYRSLKDCWFDKKEYLENIKNNADFTFTMKDGEKIQKILRDNYPTLKEQYSVESLGLFGSYVQNTQTEKSDLDLLVTFKTKPSLFGFIELENYLSDLLDVKVDLVMESALKRNIGKHIQNKVVKI